MITAIAGIVIAVAALLLDNSPSLPEQLSCYEEQLNASSKTMEYQNIQMLFTDTLNSWIQRGVRRVQSYRRNKWIIDGIALNTRKDRGFVIVLEVASDDDAMMDYINFYGIQSEPDGWHFYSASYASMGISRLGQTQGMALTFPELSLIARRNLLGSGYYRKNTCMIDDGYVDGNFKGEIHRLHERFLNDLEEDN